MLSDRIGKIAKAQQYAGESDRFQVMGDKVIVQGDHGSYTLFRRGEGWQCDCSYYQRHGWCAHTLAFEWYSGARPKVTSN